MKEDSRYANERRRALLHDRLICTLLERCLMMESVMRHSMSTDSLRRLWGSLQAKPVFKNRLAPWRYRLAVVAQHLFPQASMQVTQGCNKEVLLETL